MTNGSYYDKAIVILKSHADQKNASMTLVIVISALNKIVILAVKIDCHTDHSCELSYCYNKESHTGPITIVIPWNWFFNYHTVLWMVILTKESRTTSITQLSCWVGFVLFGKKVDVQDCHTNTSIVIPCCLCKWYESHTG